MTNNIVILLVFFIAFICGCALFATWNYFVLYIIRISGLMRMLDNTIAISLLTILFLILFIININESNGIAFAIGAFIGGMIGTVMPTYLATYLIFKKTSAYTGYSRNIKIFASIYSGLSLLLVSIALNGL